VRISLVVVALATIGRQEAAPRRPAGVAIPVKASLETISGVRPLRDGRLLLSDAKRAAVYLVDPKTGVAQQIGSAGGQSTQYAQPGGFYSGLADTIYLLDRGQARFLVISPSGSIVESRSIKRRGVSGSSSADQDFQQVDLHGLAYFIDQGHRFAALTGAVAKDSAALVRFDPSSQHYDTIATLRESEKKVTQVDEHTQFTRAIHGSPRDGWGITADGSVAVVRATPYRIDWYSPSGALTRGPVTQIEAIAYTDAEKAEISARNAKSAGSVGVSGMGASVSSASLGDLFAPTKAPFEADGVTVSSDGRVWVPRSQRATVTTVLYDVFNRRGERVDRIELPPRSRVVGFGANSVFVVERDEAGTPSLHRYSLQDQR
jgi:hypothetical protein